MMKGNGTQRTATLDHCVLPTGDLETARTRLRALGFSIAPQGTHPFGTANCCAFFQDGTYLEPLAIADMQMAGAAARNGNVFLARDQLFRQQLGDEGFSAFVIQTDDADTDHRRFVDAGISAGPPLSFSRRFTDAAGANREVSFRLAFAAPSQNDPTFFFACQRTNMPTTANAALEAHPNGVTGIACILAAAPEPNRYQSFFETMLQNRPAMASDGGLGLPLGHADLRILPSDMLEKTYGMRQTTGSALALCGIVFQASSHVPVQECLVQNNITFDRHRDTIIVPPASGQGAYFIFEESRP